MVGFGWLSASARTTTALSMSPRSSVRARSEDSSLSCSRLERNSSSCIQRWRVDRPISASSAALDRLGAATMYGKGGDLFGREVVIFHSACVLSFLGLVKQKRDDPIGVRPSV